MQCRLKGTRGEKVAGTTHELGGVLTIIGGHGPHLERAKTSPWIEYSQTGGENAKSTVAATIESIRSVERIAEGKSKAILQPKF